MNRVLMCPGTLCVCIDSVGQDYVNGKFFHRFSSRSVAFDNLLQMVMKAEKIFECAGTPQAFVNERSFKRIKNSTNNRRKLKVGSADEMTEHIGEKATFLVNVQYRQHASWQGKVTWLEGEESCSFRSVLELIKLMDSTIQNIDLKMVKLEEEKKADYDR